MMHSMYGLSIACHLHRGRWHVHGSSQMEWCCGT